MPQITSNYGRIAGKTSLACFELLILCQSQVITQHTLYLHILLGGTECYKFKNVPWGRGAKRPPVYILFYNFSITYPNFLKFDDISRILSEINIVDTFFKIRTGFYRVTTILVDISLVEIMNMNISQTILVSFKSLVLSLILSVQKKLGCTFPIISFQ